MAKKERDFDNTVLSLRLTSAEAARFWRIMDEAKTRNAYAGKSDVVRELLGLTRPAALEKAEIDFFRTGIKAANAEMIKDGESLAPHSKTKIPIIQSNNKTDEKNKQAA